MEIVDLKFVYIFFYFEKILSQETWVYFWWCIPGFALLGRVVRKIFLQIIQLEIILNWVQPLQVIMTIRNYSKIRSWQSRKGYYETSGRTRRAWCKSFGISFLHITKMTLPLLLKDISLKRSQQARRRFSFHLLIFTNFQSTQSVHAFPPELLRYVIMVSVHRWSAKTWVRPQWCCDRHEKKNFLNAQNISMGPLQNQFSSDLLICFGWIPILNFIKKFKVRSAICFVPDEKTSTRRGELLENLNSFDHEK